MTVQAAPTQTGSFSGTIKIISGALKHPSADVLIKGSAAAGRISAPTTLSFGMVKIGKTQLRKFKVSNRGAGVLHCIVGPMDPPFSVISGGGKFELSDGQSRMITVQFNPTSAQPASAKLEITSDDPAHKALDVTLSGRGK